MLLVLTGCRSSTTSPPAPTPAAGEDSAPTAVEQACPDALPSRARCGTVTVFENRARGEGKTIALAYVVLPPSSPSELESEPVFVLAGGPGQAATQLAGPGSGALARLNQSRPLVFVDQRGTGASNGLHCRPSGLSEMLEGPWNPNNAAVLDECIASLPADLTQYATPAAMDDLDDVRRALGYPMINLWGGSYGTRAGLAYLRQHGEHVRSAVLWGVAPLGHPFPRTFGPSGQVALERLMTDCQADPGCRALLPDGLATVERISAALEAEPAELMVRDPRDGREAPVRLTRDVFTEGLRLALYDVSWSAGLPAMLAAADRGDYQPLMALLVPLGVGLLTEIHFGMFLSVSCAEDVHLLTEADLEATRRTFVGDGLMVGLRQACERWPRATLPDGYLSPVTSDVPVLLMAGELDPVTPPSTAALAAEHLSHARVVTFPNVAHSTSNAEGCEAELAARFIDEPDPAALDTGCVQGLRRPPFLVPQPGAG